MPTGPRIIFKDDRDSAIGRGAVLYAHHFRPEVSAIPRAAALTAPEGLSYILVSEGHRHIRNTLDLHERCQAFDLSLNVPGIGERSEEERRAIGWAWVERMRRMLGPGYQFDVHGAGRTLHIHAELDC